MARQSREYERLLQQATEDAGYQKYAQLTKAQKDSVHKKMDEYDLQPSSLLPAPTSLSVSGAPQAEMEAELSSAPQVGTPQVVQSPSATQLTTPSVAIRAPAIADLLNPGKDNMTLGFAQGGPIHGPQGDDQILGEMPDGSPARLQDGEYVLPPDAVDALGGQASLDKFVALVTGKRPGPVEKPALDGQGMAQAFQYGGGVDKRTTNRFNLRRFADQNKLLAEQELGLPGVVQDPYAARSGMSGVRGLANLHAKRDYVLGGPARQRQEQERAATILEPQALTAPSAGAAELLPSSRPLGKASGPEPEPEYWSQAGPDVTREVRPGLSPTQQIYRRDSDAGVEFFGARRQKPMAAPAATMGPTEHDQIMAGIEAQGALAAARKLAGMPSEARGRLSADQIVGTQHRQGLQARKDQGEQRAHEMALARTGQSSFGDVLGQLNYLRNLDNDTRAAGHQDRTHQLALSKEERAREAARLDSVMSEEQLGPVVQGLEQNYDWMAGLGPEFYSAAAQNPSITSGAQIANLIPAGLAAIGEQAKTGEMTPLEYVGKQLSAQDVLNVLENNFDGLDVAGDDKATLRHEAARYVMNMIIGGTK